MAKTTILILFYCILIDQGFCQLRCYDCESSNRDKCLNPETNFPKITKCRPRPQSVVSENPPNYECYTIYYVPGSGNQSETGMYRGCIEKRPEVTSVCRFISENVHSGTIKMCTSCSSDKCNTENFLNV